VIEVSVDITISCDKTTSCGSGFERQNLPSGEEKQVVAANTKRNLSQPVLGNPVPSYPGWRVAIVNSSSAVEPGRIAVGKVTLELQNRIPGRGGTSFQSVSWLRYSGKMPALLQEEVNHITA